MTEEGTTTGESSEGQRDAEPDNKGRTFWWRRLFSIACALTILSGGIGALGLPAFVPTSIADYLEPAWWIGFGGGSIVAFFFLVWDTHVAKKLPPIDSKAELDSWKNERRFMENLFTNRFNFFLVVVSVLTAGALQVLSPNSAQAQGGSESSSLISTVAFCGAVLAGALGMTLYRCHVRVVEIFTYLKPQDNDAFDDHGRGAKRRPLRGLLGVNPLMGVWIPFFCTLGLLILAIAVGQR